MFRARCPYTPARCTPATSRASCRCSSKTAPCASTSPTRSSARPASPTPGRYGSHDRLLVHAVRLRPRHVHRAGGDSPGLATALHAAHVAYQCHLGHRRGRVDRGHGGGLPEDDSHPGWDRPLRLYDEHRQRLSDHRPHAEDVQEAMTHAIAELAAVVATALFIFALYWMNAPETAR